MNFRILSPAICLSVGALYCMGLTYTSSVGQNAATVIFVLFLAGLFILNVRNLSAGTTTLGPLLGQVAALNLGIALAAQVLHAPDAFFWVADSYSVHLPESLKHTAFFEGKTAWKIGEHYGATTHLITGLAIAVLGKNTMATILAQLMFKLVAAWGIFHIGRLLWDEKVGLVATQLYAFCPTIFFYNLVLYKEGAVQALLALVILLSLLVCLNRRLILILPLLAIYLLLLRERFYISYLLAPMTLMLGWALLPKGKALRSLVLVLVGIMVGGAVLQFKAEFMEMYDSINIHREHYASYSDFMNKYNYAIPYPLAFLKILFSPYFSFNKFALFSDFSLLLIWGALVSQIIIFSSLVGLIQNIRRKWVHGILWMPFVVFLACAAYISPWSGRLRDSFYPLIVCYAAYFLLHNRYFNKLTSGSHTNFGQKTIE